MRHGSHPRGWTTTSTEDTAPADTTSEDTAPDEPARRRTWQRAAVAAAMRQSGDFVSAQQLHARMSASGRRVGLATVYRALQVMAEDDEVDVLRNPDGEATYRRCSDGHHHHLTCRECGRTVEVDGAAAETWARQVSAEHGYTDVEHVFELFGRCGDCEPARP